MPSASQVHADSLARQAVLSLTSSLKAFPASAPQASFTAENSDQQAPNFQDAMKAAWRPPRDAVQADVPSPAPSSETPDADEDDTAPASEKKAVHESPNADRSQRGRSDAAHRRKADRKSGADDSSDDSSPVTPDTTAAPADAASTPTGADASPQPIKKADKPADPADPADPAAPGTPAPADAAVTVSQQTVVAAVTPPTVTPAAKNPPAAAATAAALITDAKPAAAAKQLAPLKPEAKPEKADAKAESKLDQPVAKHPENPAENQQPPTDDAPHQAPSLQTPARPAPKIGQPSDAPAPAAQANSASAAPPPAAAPSPVTAQAALAIATAPVAVENDAPKPQTTSDITITAAGAHPLSTITDSADPAASAQQMPADQQDQTFEQVVMGLRGKLDAQSGKAEIRLDPPNLGTLHVSIALTNGALTAQFQSSSEVVRDLLKDNMEKLKTVLQGQGIAVDKLAVESPADKVVTPGARLPNAGSPNNDGRSAGQYTRDQNPGQKRSPNSGGFGRLWRDKASATQDAPIDLVG